MFRREVFFEMERAFFLFRVSSGVLPEEHLLMEHYYGKEKTIPFYTP